MTPEQEAEARALLAQIAKTHEWAREECPGPGADVQPSRWTAHRVSAEKTLLGKEIRCSMCDGKGWLPLANLKVAFAEAVLWLAEHGAALRKVPVLIRPWWIDSTVSADWCDDPYIAVFKAVLALKEQADER